MYTIKHLWRFPINRLSNRGKVASLRHQVDSVSEVCQLPNPKVSELYLCLFSMSTKSVCRCFTPTLASMAKLVEGDEM